MPTPPAPLPPSRPIARSYAERIEIVARSIARAKFADADHDLKTEARTLRPFRPNPHD